MSPLPRWVHLGLILGVLAHWFRRVFGPSGLLGFAGLIFLLEGMGMPVPVELPLGIVGVLVNSQRMTYGETVMVTWAATVVGNSLGYYLGYYGGRPLVHKVLNWLRIPHGHFGTVEGWFKRYGLALAFGTRWINWGFAQNIWLLGISRFPFATFIAVMAVNDLLWAMAWNWVAIHFIRRLRLLGRLQKPVLLALLVLTALGLGGWWIWRRLRRTDKPEAPGGD